ncbi:Periplasmic nitrate reductase 1 [Bienertia sinuspersici]
MSTCDKNAPRRWTWEEDELLVKLLVDMNSEGKWKVNGGFKSGYLTHLEKLFSEKMPESGFKASNIDSRLSYLKKKFNGLLEIKNKGCGFGWDDNLKMVTGDRKLFEEWSKS